MSCFQSFNYPSNINCCLSKHTSQKKTIGMKKPSPQKFPSPTTPQAEGTENNISLSKSSSDKIPQNSIGIIGGVSVDSCLNFAQKLTDLKIDAKQSKPPFVLCSDPALNKDLLSLEKSSFSVLSAKTDSLHIDHSPIVENLRRTRAFLEKCGGVCCIVMPCHISHSWHDEIKEGCSIPLLHMGECVAKELKEAKMRPLEAGSPLRIGVLATNGNFVARSYQEKLEDEGFEVVLPDRATEEHTVIPAVEALKRKDLEGAQNLFRIALQVLLVRAVNRVILASDELDQFLPPNDPLWGKCIDPMDALARSSIKFAQSVGRVTLLDFNSVVAAKKAEVAKRKVGDVSKSTHGGGGVSSIQKGIVFHRGGKSGQGNPGPSGRGAGPYPGDVRWSQDERLRDFDSGKNRVVGEVRENDRRNGDRRAEQGLPHSPTQRIDEPRSSSLVVVDGPRVQRGSKRHRGSDPSSKSRLGYFSYGVNSDGVDSLWDDEDYEQGWRVTRGIINSYDAKHLKEKTDEEVAIGCAGDLARAINWSNEQFQRSKWMREKVEYLTSEVKKKDEMIAALNEKNQTLASGTMELEKLRGDLKKSGESYAQLSSDYKIVREKLSTERRTGVTFLGSEIGKEYLKGVGNEAVASFQNDKDFHGIVMAQAMSIYDDVVRRCRQQLRDTGLVTEDIVMMIEPDILEATMDEDVNRDNEGANGATEEMIVAALVDDEVVNDD